MDVDSLSSGEDYGELKDGYVIFLCLDDPFAQGLPVYTFEKRCAENTGIYLGDGAHKIFYNAAKHAIMPSGELRSFFRFLCGAEDRTALSGRLAAMGSHARSNGQWRQQFMTWEQVEMRVEERVKEQVAEQLEERAKEAAAEARAENAIETARRLLGNGKLSEQEISDITGVSTEQLAQLQLG